jgi:HTH-type transcriptional regulator/antitoxin MqsA
MDTCPVCGEPMQQISEQREVRIGKRLARVQDRCFRCSACGEDLYAPGQLDATLRRASDAIRREEGLLTPREVRAIRRKFGLTQAGLEQLLGVGPKTVVRWEKGTVFQNRATDSLLRVLNAFPEIAPFLAHLRGEDLAEEPRMPAL